MTVERIVSGKGREVVTVAPDLTLGEAVRLLSERRIGAVVVIDGQSVIGIISERDVVRAVGEMAGAALSEPVSRYMTRDLVTCTSKSSIDSLMVLMTERKFRHIPVVEEGRLGGIVSIGDIVKHRLAEMEAEGKAMRDYIATA